MKSKTWTSKTCSKCKEIKPIAKFNVDNYRADGYCTHCKDCRAIISRSYVKSNPEKTRNRYLRSYGISTAEYEKLLKNQKQCCAICLTPQAGLSKRLVVDHCHITKRVCGLLCNPCNLAIGFLRENVKNAQRAVQYLQTTKKGATK